jgi:hypothetical protein
MELVLEIVPGEEAGCDICGAPAVCGFVDGTELLLRCDKHRGGIAIGVQFFRVHRNEQTEDWFANIVGSRISLSQT